MRRLKPICAALALLASVSAAAATERQRLNLPAGRLGDAIVQLGRQARVDIGVSDPSLALRPVPAVSGNMTVEQALERMLRGSGARFVAVDGRTFRILRGAAPVPRRTLAARPRPTPAPVLEPIPVALVEDIIVTAARRPATLASYPAVVDIIGSDDPELNAGLRGSDALVARLPGLSSTHLGPGRNKLFIRGIADSSFNGPTQATSGQYLGDTRISYVAPDPDLRLFDIDRIEVLQGPQGTLYGAGSLGGIIRIQPNAPRLDAMEAMASFGISATDHGEPGADGAGVLNFPLVTDRLGLRLVAYGSSEGGYIDDPSRGLDDINRVSIVGGRAALRLAAPSGWTVDLRAVGQSIRGEDGQFADDPTLRQVPPLTRASMIAQPFESDYLLGDLVVTRDWGATQLVSSLGIVRHESQERYDATLPGGEARIYDQRRDVTMLSAETRLSGETGNTSWLIGTSLLSNESEQHRQTGPVQGPTPLPGIRNAVQETSLFGELGWRIAPDVTVTGGGRISYSRLSGAALDAPVRVMTALGPQGRRDEFALLPSLGLTWEARPGLQFFARYQEGFRAGGLGVTGDFVQAFDNDRVATAEAGLRHSAAGGAFAARASLAYTRWNDIQADTISYDGFPLTANIGDGEIWTADFSLAWRPLPGLSAEIAGVVNRSEVLNPTPAFTTQLKAGGGDFQLPNVADLAGRASLDYLTSLGGDTELRLSAAARYTGESRLGTGPILGREQGDIIDVTLGARLGWGSHTLSLTLTNLTDEVGNRFALGSPFTLMTRPQITPLRPRTLRLGWQIRF